MRVRLVKALMSMLLPLVVLAGLGGCSGMYFRDAGVPPSAISHRLDSWPYEEYWTGVVFNGAKVGYTHLYLPTPLISSWWRVSDRKRSHRWSVLLGA